MRAMGVPLSRDPELDLSFLLPLPVRSAHRGKARSGGHPWRPEEGVGAAADPFAGVRVPRRESVPPSSGFATVPWTRAHVAGDAVELRL